MFSYFSSVSKVEETRLQKQHYEGRLKEFISSFEIALPKIAVTTINDVARHRGSTHMNLNIVKLMELYHKENTHLYQNYYIALSDGKFEELLKLLESYLMNEGYSVHRTKNEESIVELSVEWK